MNINYDKIANSVINDAVRTNLRSELKKHCLKVAQEKSKSWLSKNKKTISASIEQLIDLRMKSEIPGLVKKSVNAIKVKAPVKSYY